MMEISNLSSPTILVAAAPGREAAPFRARAEYYLNCGQDLKCLGGRATDHFVLEFQARGLANGAKRRT